MNGKCFVLVLLLLVLLIIVINISIIGRLKKNIKELQIKNKYPLVYKDPFLTYL